MKTYKSFYLHEALDENPTGLGIIVNFDDYTTGEAVASQLELSNNDIVDNLYMYSNYQMLDRRGDDDAVTVLVRLWDRFIANHEHELSSMLSALYTKYNPLENYNKHGHIVNKHTGSDSVSGSSGNTKTLNTTNSVNGTSGNTKTLNTTNSVNGSVNTTDTYDTDNKTTYGSGSSTTIGTHTDTHTTPQVTTTHSEGSYDSNTLKSVSSDSTTQVQVTDVFGSQTNGVTNTGNDTFEQNGTVEHDTTNSTTTTDTGTVTDSATNNTTTTDTGTITDSGTNSESTTYNSTNTIIDTTHGNIGITQNTEMAMNELALRKYSFIDYLMAYFVGTMCYYVEDVDWGDFR